VSGRLAKKAHIDKSHIVMVIAVAAIAFAADDTVHEAIGHGLACWVLGIKVLSISTVALQAAESSRWLSAAGALANVVAGIAAFASFGRLQGFTTFRYFLWLFGFANLMNGTGYLMASALFNNGDWAVVIAGWTPAWAWRAGMGLTGLLAFYGSIRWASALMGNLVSGGLVAARDVSRLCVPAYITGGLMFVAASALNRITPGLILGSGVGASFGLTFGLLIVPGITTTVVTIDGLQPRTLTLHWGWVITAAVVGGVFIAVFGPGIHLN